MAVGGTPWLFLFGLFLSHTAAQDRTIYITLVPRDYVDPRTAADFICGVEKTVDQDRLLAELNAPYIFDFADKTEETKGYQSRVIDVVSFSPDGQSTKMLECPQDEETALVSLFVVPPSLQCNSRTFEDAELAGRGYYPVFLGTRNDMEEAVQKFEQAAVALKPEYGGRFPKLCGAFSSMKNATASNRAKTMNLLFNFAFGKEFPHRALDLTDWKVCKTKEETTNSIISSEIFDTSSNIEFKKERERKPEGGGEGSGMGQQEGDSGLGDYKLVYVSESDGFVELDIVNRQVTSKKAVIMVETEFSSNPNFAVADVHDIVPFNGFAVFEANSNETSVFVRIKEDSKNEKAEYFSVTLNPLKVRAKRMALKSNKVIKNNKKTNKKTSGTVGVVIADLYNFYEFTDTVSYKWRTVWYALERRPAFSILAVEDFDPNIASVVPRPTGWHSKIYSSNIQKQIGDQTKGLGSVPTTNEYTNLGYHRGHLLSSEAIRTFLNKDPVNAKDLSISMLNIFPQNGKCNSGNTVAGTNTHPVWRQVEGDTIKAGRDCIFGGGTVKTGNIFYIAHALVSSGYAPPRNTNIGFPDVILTNYCCVTPKGAIVTKRLVLTQNTESKSTCEKLDSEDPKNKVGDIWAAYLSSGGKNAHPFEDKEGKAGCIRNN